MTVVSPDPRTIRRALEVVQRLPTEALAELAERIIDRLDAAEPDPDLEPNGDEEPDDEDCCEADDDHLGQPQFYSAHSVRVGYDDDAEPDDGAEHSAVPSIARCRWSSSASLKPPPHCGPAPSGRSEGG